MSKTESGPEGSAASGLREKIAENQLTIDRLNRDLARKSNEVRIIQQISSEITSTLDLDEVLAIVLGAMERVLGFQYSMVLLKDLAQTKLRVFASRGYEPNGVGAEVALGHGVLGVVAERKRMIGPGRTAFTVTPAQRLPSSNASVFAKAGTAALETM